MSSRSALAAGEEVLARRRAAARTRRRRGESCWPEVGSGGRNSKACGQSPRSFCARNTRASSVADDVLAVEGREQADRTLAHVAGAPAAAGVLLEAARREVVDERVVGEPRQGAADRGEELGAVGGGVGARSDRVWAAVSQNEVARSTVGGGRVPRPGAAAGAPRTGGRVQASRPSSARPPASPRTVARGVVGVQGGVVARRRCRRRPTRSASRRLHRRSPGRAGRHLRLAGRGEGDEDGRGRPARTDRTARVELVAVGRGPAVTSRTRSSIA